MTRYIDADALSIYFDALIKHAEMEGLYNMAHVYERCLQIVKDAPTADVAPRAEVTREIFEEMDKIMLPILHEVSQVYIYAKIKKKYTEAEPPKGE